MKNAFNSVRHSLIIGKLRDRGVSRYLVNFVSSYLTDRSVEIEKGEARKTNAGVPQGSVLGPMLWNVLYDGVLGLGVTENATCVGFADNRH